MIKTDYSSNAKLLEYENYDYDTSRGYRTGINKDRVRLPDRYDIKKSYQHYNKYMKNHRGEEVRTGKGRWVKNNKAPDFGGDDFDWQITYRFPKEMRNPFPNGFKYGGEHVTYRRLYVILCEHFNHGRYFIEDYFNFIYPNTLKPYVDEKLKTIKEHLMNVFDNMWNEAQDLNKATGLGEFKVTKRGTLNKHYSRVNASAYDMLDRYEVYASSWENAEGIELALAIKSDIERCLADGAIPLDFVLDRNTIRKRKKAMLPGKPELYASGELIRSIEIFVNLGGNGQWLTHTGLMV